MDSNRSTTQRSMSDAGSGFGSNIGTGSRHPLCIEFRHQWSAGGPPSLDRFLRDAVRQPPPARFERLALELVKIDMECRWLTDGTPSAARPSGPQQAVPASPLPNWPLVDDYTRAFPQLGRTVDVPLELIRLEYRLRCQRGMRPAADEYFERFKRREDILEILDLVDESQASTPPVGSRGAAPSARAIRLSCPHCREPVSAEDDQSRALTCGHCGHSIRLVSGTTLPVLEGDRFEIIERLGIGGFGTVWKARDRKLDRIVALKLPRRGQFDVVETEKFFREARAAAQLNHENIVTIHDFDGDGDECFIVSEIVEGVSLSKWLEEHELGFLPSAKLCHTIALALDYAHRQGVVHRDLKPSNIIVDKNLVPHITDFGLAKRDVGEVTMTIDGQLLGTPSYMSPEQASGHGHEVDGRADIYALGVMLYRLLTGELPFRGDVHMMLHHVVHNDPIAPRQLNHRIPRDLETICLKCLEKQPSRRFATAGELAEELKRFLNGQPIKSRPLSSAARVWRWARRHRTAALAGALLLFISAASPIVVWRESYHRKETVQSLSDSIVAQAAAEAAGRASGFRQRAIALVKAAIRLVPGRDRAQLRDIVTRTMGEFLGFEPTVVELNGVISNFARDDVRGWFAVGLSDGDVAILRSDGSWFASYRSAAAITAPAEARPIRALRIEPSDEGGMPTVVTVSADGRVLRRHPDRDPELIAELALYTIDSAEFTADGQWLAVVGQSAVEVWNAQVWTKLVRLPLEVEGLSKSVCFSSDGRYVAAGYTAGEPDRCGFVMWDLATGRCDAVHLPNATSNPNSICFSHDGSYLLFGCSKLMIYDVATLQLIEQLPSHDVYAVAASGDGRYLASYNYQGDIQIWNASSWQLLAECSSPAYMNSGGRFDNYFSPTGSHFVASYGNMLRIWDLNVASERQRLIAHREKIGAVTFSHDGSLAAAASFDGTVSVWDVDKCTLVAKPLDVGARVHCVAFSPDDRYLAAATWDTPGIYLWSTSDWRRVEVRNLREDQLDDAVSLAFHPRTGHLVASTGTGLGIFQLCETEDGVSLERVRVEPAFRALCMVLCANSDNAAWLAGNEKSVRLFDLNDLTSTPLAGGQAIALDGWHALALFPDGRRLIFVGPQKKLEIWDIVEGKRLEVIEHAGELHLSLIALSADGTMLATKSDPKSVVIWDTRTWERLIALPAEHASVAAIAWHPKQPLILVGAIDGLISVWDITKINQVLDDLQIRPAASGRETQEDSTPESSFGRRFLAWIRSFSIKL